MTYEEFVKSVIRIKWGYIHWIVVSLDNLQVLILGGMFIKTSTLVVEQNFWVPLLQAILP